VYDEGLPVDGLQQKLNITGTADPNGVPGIGLTGFTGFGTSTGLIGNLDNVYQIADGFNWLHGNHQIKFGAEIAYLRTIQSSANANARGVSTSTATSRHSFPAAADLLLLPAPAALLRTFCWEILRVHSRSGCRELTCAGPRRSLTCRIPGR
jgi:hypothetical protein